MDYFRVYNELEKIRFLHIKAKHFQPFKNFKWRLHKPSWQIMQEHLMHLDNGLPQ